MSQEAGIPPRHPRLHNFLEVFFLFTTAAMTELTFLALVLRYLGHIDIELVKVISNTYFIVLVLYAGARATHKRFYPNTYQDRPNEIFVAGWALVAVAVTMDTLAIHHDNIELMQQVCYILFVTAGIFVGKESLKYAKDMVKDRQE